ncbi:MAG: hypothetical protein ACO1NW_17825 [Chitinophagaceae bacterium]
MKKMLLFGVLFLAADIVLAQQAVWKDKLPVKTNVVNVRYDKESVTVISEEVYVQTASDDNGSMYTRTVTVQAEIVYKKKGAATKTVQKASAIYEVLSKAGAKKDTFRFNVAKLEERYKNFIYTEDNNFKSRQDEVVYEGKRVTAKTVDGLHKADSSFRNAILKELSTIADSTLRERTADRLMALLPKEDTLKLAGDETATDPVKPEDDPNFATDSTTKKRLKKIYETHYFKILRFKRRPWLYFGANFAPQGGGRAVFVRQSDFTANEKVDQRGQNERAGFSSMASAVVGMNFGGSRHALYSEFIYRNDRFSSEGSYIDFSSGLPIANAGTTTKYRFESKGLGIGYVSAPAQRLKGAVLDLGIAHFWQHYAKTITGAAINNITPAPRDRYFTAKFGLGFQYRFRRLVAIRTVPTVYYNLTSASKGALSTNLVNYGVNVGIYYTAKRNKL